MTESNKGVLGRGPAFWAVMVFVSTALLMSLIAFGAIERSIQLLLTIVPIALAMVMFRAGYNAAGAPAGSCTGKGEAQTRYITRTAIFTSLYLATFGLLMFAHRELEITGEVKFVLALLPGLAIIGVFWAIARLLIEETDEFMRMLVVRQALIATAFAMSAATVWGFLESVGIVPHIEAFYWAMAWFFGLFIGSAANRVQYGTWGAV